DSSEGFRDFIDYNVEAEALGFHGTFVVEHHFTGYGQVSATINLLTWLGARTSTLRLGTAVIVLPWHNPVLLAEQAATLDLLSGGRLDCGIGKGYRYKQFAGFCVDMVEADARSQVGVTRAFFVCDNDAEKETALERRLANRVRQLKLATRADGTVMAVPIAPPAIPTSSTATVRSMAPPARSPRSSTSCAASGSVMCWSMAADRAEASAAARASDASGARQ